LNLTVAVPKENPVLQTVMGYFPPAETYERELIDLLGMKVEGLPPGSRYPLPEGWPEGQYPLRKDWNVKMLEGATPSGPVPKSYFPESN
jgi:Ni,Fe-hydrogenase III component G